MPEEFNLFDHLIEKVKVATKESLAEYELVRKRDMEPLMRSRDVMEYLSISAPTLKAWRDSGRIKFYVVNGKYRYKRYEVEGLLQ